MIRNLAFLLLILSLTSCNLFRQASQSAMDPGAETLISQGKRLLRADDFPEAMDKFEMAWDRDMHRSSSVALYLSGLSAYYANFDDIATQRFETLLKVFPKSRYAEEARFHLALVGMRSPNARERNRGFSQLTGLQTQARNQQIREQARMQWKKFIFEGMPIAELEQTYAGADASDKSVLLEALCYRLLSKQQRAEARERYDAYLADGGRTTPYLDQMFPEKAEEPVLRLRTEPNMFRIALMLPFHLDNPRIAYSREIPNESVRGLEFYEGFQMAIDEAAPEVRKQVYLKTYDTRRDTSVTKMHLKELEMLQPDIIVGGIYNNQSRIIAEWAETYGITQLIPLSPTEELVAEKQHVFLAHPSVRTHGARMAEYAHNSLGLTTVSVFTDRSSGTQPLADGFSTKFLELGGTVDTMILDQDYEIAVKQIPRLVDSVPNYEDGVGVYIPLMNNEESAGLIVNLLKQRTRDVVVMGSPHFRTRYNTLSRDTKESYELLFSTSHMVSPRNEAYRDFYNRYLKKYEFPPSDHAIQGYDLGKYLLHLVKQYNPSPGTFHTYLKGNHKYEGLHLKYWFDYGQSNQDVNIGQYREDGVVRVNE